MLTLTNFADQSRVNSLVGKIHKKLVFYIPYLIYIVLYQLFKVSVSKKNLQVIRLPTLSRETWQKFMLNAEII